VTSVSVMVGRATRDSVRALRDAAPRAGVGLHVDLTSDLVHPAPGDPARCVAEQVDRFVELAGESPDHLNAHKHLHRGRADVLAAMAAHGVPVRADRADVRRVLRRAGARCPDHLVGDVGARAWWSGGRLRREIAALRPGVTELMCHPGYADGLPPGITYREQRADELRALLAPRFRRWLAAQKVELVSFRALALPRASPCE